MTTAAPAAKKITIATVKAFIRRNMKAGTLLVRSDAEFSGMTDCVESNRDAAFVPAVACHDNGNNVGVRGVYFVGSSGNYCTPFADGDVTGFRVSNCCGRWVVAARN